MFGIYAAGLIVAIVCAMILKKDGAQRVGIPPFVMELPPYRLPTLKTLWMHLYERIKDFVVRAGTILLAGVDRHLVSAVKSAPGCSAHPRSRRGNMLTAIGKFIMPVFIPLRFGFLASVSGLVSWACGGQGKRWWVPSPSCITIPPRKR